jgi:hypothetical protein
MAGGAMVAISFAVLAVKLLAVIQAGDRYSIHPGKQLVLKAFINSTAGAYFVSPVEPTDVSPTATVTGPSNTTIIANRPIDAYTAFSQFPSSRSGNYTLILSNPSSNSTIEITAAFGAADLVFSKTLDLNTTPLIFATLFSGIGAVIVGGVVTVLDRRRISKMKQYGDTSDLV